MSEPRLKFVMTGYGTVRNPDGTEKKIELRAERPFTEAERAQYEALVTGVEENGSNDCSSR